MTIKNTNKNKILILIAIICLLIGASKDADTTRFIITHLIAIIIAIICLFNLKMED